MFEKLRTPVRSGDLVAFFEPSEGPLEALWGHSWGAVSAYPKKAREQRRCRKTVSGGEGGAEGKP